eukprot:g17050.t1
MCWPTSSIVPCCWLLLLLARSSSVRIAWTASDDLFTSNNSQFSSFQEAPPFCSYPFTTTGTGYKSCRVWTRRFLVMGSLPMLVEALA